MIAMRHGNTDTDNKIITEMRTMRIQRDDFLSGNNNVGDDTVRNDINNDNYIINIFNIHDYEDSRIAHINTEHLC